MEKTLAQLRKVCAANGIKLKKQSFSHGPHLSFYIEGVATHSIFTTEFYNAHREKFEALQRIKGDFVGMTIDGEKVYGLK